MSFKEWFIENWPYIASVITAILTCVLGSLGYTVKVRSDNKALTIEKTRLEEEKTRLTRAIIEGSYIICPNCGEEIFLKDVEIKTKGVNE